WPRRESAVEAVDPADYLSVAAHAVPEIQAKREREEQRDDQKDCTDATGASDAQRHSYDLANDPRPKEIQGPTTALTRTCSSRSDKNLSIGR
ncbi:MAG TPA: hypothetical protein VJV76_06815, partial [Gaiellaceae bacterium]|nr:hypothetical protein [Gaiellaceae bacterium]